MRRSPMPFDDEFDFAWRPAHPAGRDRSSTRESQEALSKDDPSFLGGLFLPEAESPGELEVASVTLASTTADLVAVFVAPTPSGWRVRVVDEYADDGSWFRLERDEFPEFPTLGEIIEVMESVECSPEWVDDPDARWGIVERFWEERRKSGSADIDTWVEVSSRTYPDLARYWQARLEHFKSSG